MIRKLALFCYRNYSKLENTFISLTILGSMSYIAMVVIFSKLKISTTNGHITIISVPVGIAIISAICLIISFFFQRKAEKLPEVILEKAKAVKDKLEHPGVQAFFEHWIQRAEKGDFDYLVVIWPVVQSILADEKKVREAEERLRKANGEISKFISLNHNIGCD